MTDATDVPSLVRALRAAGLHSSADTLTREADERGLLPRDDAVSPSRVGGSRSGADAGVGGWTGEVGGPVLAARR